MNEVTILVPGFKDDIHFLAKLAKRLEAAGFVAECISPQPSNGAAPIELLAGQVARAITARFAPEQPLNLVGFSMGGLICRTYVQHLGGSTRTRRLITLATPHQGTYSAYLLNRPAGYQMRPGSAFLATLNEDLAALARVRVTSIWTPLDVTIVPAHSSRLPIGEMVAIWSPFHATLPSDPRVVQAVVRALRQPVEVGEQTKPPIPSPSPLKEKGTASSQIETKIPLS